MKVSLGYVIVFTTSYKVTYYWQYLKNKVYASNSYLLFHHRHFNLFCPHIRNGKLTSLFKNSLEEHTIQYYHSGHLCAQFSFSLEDYLALFIYDLVAAALTAEAMGCYTKESRVRHRMWAYCLKNDLFRDCE